VARFSPNLFCLEFGKSFQGIFEKPFLLKIIREKFYQNKGTVIRISIGWSFYFHEKLTFGSGFEDQIQVNLRLTVVLVTFFGVLTQGLSHWIQLLEVLPY